MTNGRFSVLHLSHLADQAERFMLTAYERLPRALVLHNDSWGISLAGHAREIALRRPGVSPDLPPLARAIAYLHACRYWGEGPELRPIAAVAQEFREWTGPDFLNLQLTLATVLPGGSSPLRGEVADVLYDAQLAQRLLSGVEGAELTWLESRYAGSTAPHVPPNRTEALSHYLDELRQARFRDGELRRSYQHTHSAVLLEMQRLVDRLRRKENRSSIAASPPLRDIEGGPTRQASQTYFRTTFHNQIQLKQMADRKAAVMIGVNALLIGALIAFVSYHNWAQSRPEFLLPVVVFIVCALTSLVYALISSRPHEREGEEDNLAFYGTAGRLHRDEFVRRTEEMLLDPRALYGSLIADLHGLGRTVQREYRLLRMAYHVFLVGLTVSVLLLLAIIFLF